MKLQPANALVLWGYPGYKIFLGARPKRLGSARRSIVQGFQYKKSLTSIYRIVLIL